MALPEQIQPLESELEARIQRELAKRVQKAVADSLPDSVRPQDYQQKIDLLVENVWNTEMKSLLTSLFDQINDLQSRLSSAESTIQDHENRLDFINA